MEKRSSKYLMFDRPHKINMRYIVKIVSYPIFNIWYKLLCSFIPKDHRTCKYTVSICSIFKNESKNLIEWIEYHLIVGVEHFYLYNNNSSDNYEEILKPYIESNIVTLVEWPPYPGQCSAYNDCWEKHKNSSQWIAFIDCDEFICPRYNQNITDFLNSYSNYPIVLMYWLMFGTSGIFIRKEGKCMIEQLTSCYEKPINIGKCIINTRFQILPFDKSRIHIQTALFHSFEIPPINYDRNFIVRDIHRINTFPMSIQLNHYWSRFYSDYLEKQKRGGGISGQWITDNVFLRNENHNKAKDFLIFRYLIQLKIKLKEKGYKIE